MLPGKDAGSKPRLGVVGHDVHADDALLASEGAELIQLLAGEPQLRDVLLDARRGGAGLDLGVGQDGGAQLALGVIEFFDGGLL